MKLMSAEASRVRECAHWSRTNGPCDACIDAALARAVVAERERLLDEVERLMVVDRATARIVAALRAPGEKAKMLCNFCGQHVEAVRNTTPEGHRWACTKRSPR